MLVAVFLAAPAPQPRVPALRPRRQATIVAGGLVVLVGIVDDILGIGAVTKLAGQAAAAGVLVAMGVSWTLVYLPFGDGNILVLDQLQAGLLLVVFTLTIVNAMNFVDGLDGLAAGLRAIAAIAICVFSVGIMLDQGGTVGAYPPALVTAVLAGALLGFLPHNFQPARIFMGDSGSMLIGLVLAAASASASGKISQSLYEAQEMIVLLSPVIVVAAAMFVPMLDLVMAVVRRVGAEAEPVRPGQDAPASPAARPRSFPSARRPRHLRLGLAHRLRSGRGDHAPVRGDGPARRRGAHRRPGRHPGPATAEHPRGGPLRSPSGSR